MAPRDELSSPRGKARAPAQRTVAPLPTCLPNEIDLEEVAGLEPAQRPPERTRGFVLEGLSCLHASGPGSSSADRRCCWLGSAFVLIADHSVTEIMVNGPEDVIERSDESRCLPLTSEAEFVPNKLTASSRSTG